MGFISFIQSHSRCESLSAVTERRTVPIRLRVIMGVLSEQNMSSDHIYSAQCSAMTGLAGLSICGCQAALFTGFIRITISDCFFTICSLSHSAFLSAILLA